MKFLKPLLLALAVTESMADSGLAGRDASRAANKTLFQATRWLSPVGFSPDRDTLASPVNDASGTPAFLQLFAPKGGRLSHHLQIPEGYTIKKILLCSNQNRPLTGVKVQLAQDGPPGSAMQLPFQRMSIVATGCAVYALSAGMDDWGLPGQSLDAKLYTTLEIMLPPSRTQTEIEAVGIRLQAAAPPYPAPMRVENQPRPACQAAGHGNWATGGPENNGWGAGENCRSGPPSAAKDDVANVYFTRYAVDSGHPMGGGKPDDDGRGR
jgi:hypothetical protein